MKQFGKLLLLLLISSFQLKAVKYYVNDGSTTGDVYCTAVGNAANNGLSPSTPKLTLANVLTVYSASFLAGDTIFIDSGNYTEIQLSSPINGVVIKGAGLLKTIITKSGSDRYFMLINDNNTVLMDMKLVGYDNQTTLGVQALGIANNTTGVKIINVQVDGCMTTSTLGGYPIEIGSGCVVSLIGGGVTCNTWDAGGGIHIAGATTSVTIRNYQFIGNYQLFGNGTALNISNGIVNIYNSRFESNTIGGDKSGMGIDMTTGTVNVYDCYFYKNLTNILSNNIGGAVSVHGGTFRVTRSVFQGNIPQPATSGIYGAGMGVTGGSVVVDSCRFFANSGTRANDLYVGGGNVLARYCIFGSAANQIGIAGAATFSIANSGAPSEYGVGIFKFNTTTSSYTANPTLPDYVPVTCVVVPCATANITSGTPTSTICSGGTFATNLTASTNSAQTSFTWASSSVAGILGHSTSGLNNINETLVNTTSNTLVVIYTVTPIFNLNCIGTPAVYNVSVFPTTTLSASSATICSGASATINPTGASNYTLQPGNVTGTSFILSPTVTSNYSVTGNALNGCPSVGGTFTINVASLPTVGITSSTSPSICPGGSVVITPNGANNYTLLPNNTSGTSFTVSPNSNSTYTITGSSSIGCLSQNISTVVVSIFPSPTINVTSATSPSICPGNSVVIIPSGAQTYTLLPSNTSGTNFTVSPNSNTTYTIIGTSSDNCIAANSATVNVSILPTPTITASGNASICPGGSVVITPGGAQSYTLLPSNISGNSFTVSPNGNITYTITGTDSQGCRSVNDATASVFLYTSPTASANSTLTTVCLTGSINLTGSSSASNSTYTWSLGSGVTNINQNQQNITISANTLGVGSYVYTLVVTSSEGCLSAAATTTIDVITVPNASVSANPVAVCLNEQGMISVNSPQSGVVYTWNINGVSTTGSSSIAVTPTLSAVAGVYTVSLYASLGTCTNISYSTFTVNPLPLIAVTNPTVSECPGNNVQLSVLNPASNYSYTWVYNSNTVGNGPTLPINSISNSNIGTYTVSVIDNNSCRTSTVVFVELKKCDLFIPEIFTPNGDGNNETFTIEHIEEYPNNNLKIFNRWGNLVFEKDGYKNEFDGHANVKDAVGKDKLPVGTYYVFLKLNDGKTPVYSGILQLQY